MKKMADIPKQTIRLNKIAREDHLPNPHHRRDPLVDNKYNVNYEVVEKKARSVKFQTVTGS